MPEMHGTPGTQPAAGPNAGPDRRMELVIGRLLQVGVTLASVVVLLGGVLYLRAHAGEPVSYKTFRGESLGRAGTVLRGAVHGDPAALIQLGVLLLIATPVARVAVMAGAFLLERDRLYLAISLAVLAILLFGLLHGS